MSTYAIGDLQGCYDSLLALLDRIQFNEHDDHLWFTGDLINRGPQSLLSLRFVKNLQSRATTVLGNHDLTFLAIVYGHAKAQDHPTLHDLLKSSDRDELCHWLRHQPLLYHDPTLNYVMTHAGIYPWWDLPLAKRCAQEVEQALRGDDFADFLKNMYGNEPACWSESLRGFDRLRMITNAFTRMRVCQPNGALNLTYKSDLAHIPEGLVPWYDLPAQIDPHIHIIFGHWAALNCQATRSHLHPIDSGCYWGNQLTALCLETQQRFEVSCRER